MFHICADIQLFWHVDVLDPICQLQEVPEGSDHEAPLVQTKGGHAAVQGQIHHVFIVS
jgi:hypothetical protein